MPQHAPRPPFFALSFLALFAAGLAAAALPSVGRAAEQIEAFSVPDRQDGEHFRGTGVGIPPRPVATTFDIDKRDAANFTSFSGGELREEGGSIAFSVAADATETLGWGNVDGTQPADEQWTMPEELAHVTLRIRQAHPAETTVRMHYTRYGDEVGIHEAQDVTATLSGMEWRELRFEQLGFYKSYGAPADGLRFVFDNAADREQRYEIDWIRIEQPRREAYIRRGFVLPDGPILRATAEVSGMDKVRWYRRAVVRQELWINGQKVERLGNLYHLRTGIADIAPYLRPGKNVIGMRGYGVLQPPMLYVEATAMQSGGVTNVMTGEGDWAWSWSADEGWSTVGFDDSGWKPLRARSETTAIEGERDEPSEPYLWRKPDLAFPVYDGSLPLPDWLGLIRLEHGGGADELSFRSDRDAVVHAVVPDLDSFQDPAVEFTLHRTEPDGTNGPAVLAKRVSRTVNGDNSGTLAFPLPLGRLEGGVYTLSTRLIAADGEVLEARPREPILVVSHIEQPEMTGDDPYAALTLDESDSLFIDFTDRSHQQGRDWVETMPGLHGNDPSSEVESWDAAKLKTLNGETYRETFGTTRGSMFSYRFEGDPDGPFQYAPASTTSSSLSTPTTRCGTWRSPSPPSTPASGTTARPAWASTPATSTPTPAGCRASAGSTSPTRACTRWTSSTRRRPATPPPSPATPRPSRSASPASSRPCPRPASATRGSSASTPNAPRPTRASGKTSASSGSTTTGARSPNGWSAPSAPARPPSIATYSTCDSPGRTPT